MAVEVVADGWEVALLGARVLNSGGRSEQSNVSQ